MRLTWHRAQGSRSLYTGALSYSVMIREWNLLVIKIYNVIKIRDASGVGGGVVSQTYFQIHFGLVNDDGTINKAKADDVSSNVVSVLQAGAFFGALGSAPISCASAAPSDMWQMLTPHLLQPRLDGNGLCSGSPFSSQ